MKKLSLFIMFGIFVSTANAAPGSAKAIMDDLTDTQTACIESHNCPRMEMPAMQPGKKPESGARPEMTAKMQESREGMQRALESCGIQMPERGERGERTETNGVKQREVVPR